MKIKLASLCAVFMIALVSGCGGGGGGSPATPTPTTTQAPAPTASLSAAPSTTLVASDGSGLSIVIKLSITNADSSDASKLVLLCNNKPILFTSNSVVVSGVSTSTIVPTVSLTIGENCTLSGDITTTGAGGSVKTPISTAFTVASSCTAPAVATPGINACVTPMGINAVKTMGFHQLPAGCTQSTQQCFKDAIPHMAAADSGGTNSTGDHITWLAFRNTTVVGSITGLWNVLPFYTKNGLRAAADIGGGYTDEIDGVWGSSNGVIKRQKNSQTCFEITVAGTATSIACPLN